MILQWHITNRCDHRCRHCYQDEHSGGETPPEAMGEILEQWEELLALRRRQGDRRAHLHVTGGEPLLHPRIWPLLERLAAARERCSFALLTNGGLLDRTAANRLARLGPRFVQVSLDGTPATHDALRGPGDHARVVAAIRALVGAGVAVSLSFTAHGGNYTQFPAVAALGRRLGVQRVWSDRHIPTGRGGATALPPLTPAQTRHWVTLLGRSRNRWWQRGHDPVGTGRALQFLAGGGGHPYRCTAGEGLLALLPDGTVLPCRRLPLPLGNLWALPLARIHQEAPLARELRDRERCTALCPDCRLAPWCRGGLRCLAHAHHGDPFHPDPGCWRIGRP